MQILKATDQQYGDVFNGTGGLSHILLHSEVDGQTYTLQAKIKSEDIWVDTDVVFTCEGLIVFYANPDLHYRMALTVGDVAGAIAHYKALGL